MVAFRTWLRGLSQPKNLEIITKEVQSSKKRNSQFLIDYVREYDPNIRRASSAKALVDVVVQKFTDGMPDKTMLEVFGLLKKVFEAVRSYDGSDSALQVDYKEIRKPIIKKYGNPSKMYTKSIELMRFDQNKWATNREEAQKKVAEKNKSKVQFKDSYVYEVMDNISATDDSWASLSILAQLATGCRSGEILSYSSFSPVEGKEGWVRQDGVSKQEHKMKAKQREYVEKPVLHISVEQFINVVNNIRDQLANDIKRFKGDHYKLSSSKNPTINRKVKHFFKDHPNVDQLTSHTMRKIYGNLSYHSFANKSEESEQSWLSRMLGHQEGVLQVATSYSVVHVNSKEQTQTSANTAIGDLNAKNKTTEQAIAELSTRLEELSIQINSKKKVDKVETFVDVPRNSKLRNGRVLDRLKKSVKVMETKNMDINSKTLRSLGYGTAVIKTFMGTYKAK